MPGRPEERGAVLRILASHRDPQTEPQNPAVGQGGPGPGPGPGEVSVEGEKMVEEGSLRKHYPRFRDAAYIYICIYIYIEI